MISCGENKIVPLYGHYKSLISKVTLKIVDHLLIKSKQLKKSI